MTKEGSYEIIFINTKTNIIIFINILTNIIMNDIIEV